MQVYYNVGVEFFKYLPLDAYVIFRVGLFGLPYNILASLARRIILDVNIRYRYH